MSSYLVTGGAGFIGSNIVEELLRQKERVRVLDNFATGNRDNLLPFQGSIELVEGSVTDLETVRAAVQGVDVVLHQAALPSVPRSIEQPINSNEVNVVGTLNVLVASKDSGVKRVVLASSSSVYGNTEAQPKEESMVPHPLSPYAVSKHTSEAYARVFHSLYGLETIALRYFNVFGPRQDPHSQYSAVIPRFIKHMMNGDSPVIYGNGLQSRDFSYVDNIVLANLLAAKAPNVGGQVVNVACGEAHTLLNLVEILNGLLGLHIKPVFAAPRKGEVLHSSADIAAARKLLGYKPTVLWEEGLRRTLDWLMSRGVHHERIRHV